jgi:hypothetical protein
MDADQLQVFARSGAAARAPVRRVGRARFRNEFTEAAATLAPRRWTVLPIGEGPAPTVAPNVKTFVEYQALVNAMNRGGARWQVVPASEVKSRDSDAG